MASESDYPAMSTTQGRATTRTRQARPASCSVTTLE
jgi:hypothetical protein